MAKKSLILSGDDGRVLVSNTSSLSVDDITENIPLSSLTSSILNIAGIADIGEKLLKILSNGTASSFTDNNVNNSTIVWNGTSWTNSTLSVGTKYTGSTGGHISGNIDGNIKVLSIVGVNSGTLPTNNGGTGKNFAASNNAVLQISKSAGGVVTYMTSSTTSSTVLTVQDGRLVLKYPAYYPNVVLYSSPGSYTWTKPPGTTFARVMVQGAGGGGGGGGTGTTSYGGGGGSSGGFTDRVVNVSSIQSAAIFVGSGGSGGAGNTIALSQAGSAGQLTSFSATGIYIAASGGGGGIKGSNAANVPSVGTGSISGSAGASPNATTAAQSSYGMPSGGGRGQGSAISPTVGGIVTNILNSTNKNFGYSVDSSGSAVTITIGPGSTGASTGGAAPSQPNFGAGGGGGWGGTTAGQFSAGGQGGNGYAFIISW